MHDSILVYLNAILLNGLTILMSSVFVKYRILFILQCSLCQKGLIAASPDEILIASEQSSLDHCRLIYSLFHIPTKVFI